MKKKTLMILFIMVLVLATGCGKKEKINTKGAWVKDLTEKQAYIDKDAKDAFDRAVLEIDGMEYEAVALLGKQVVAGTNYMFLTKGTTVTEKLKTTYKIVVVYNDLENKSSITSVKDFDITKYVNKNIEYNKEEMTGAWEAYMPEKSTKLDSEVQEVFDDATGKLAGISYQPIALLGHKEDNGVKYAVMCYATFSTVDMDKAIYLITLSEDENGTREIVSSANVNLADFSE